MKESAGRRMYQQVNATPAQKEGDSTAGKGKHQSFSQTLPGQAIPAGSQSRSHREFAPLCMSSRQEKICKSGAGHQQEQGYGSEQHAGSQFCFIHDAIAEGTDDGADLNPHFGWDICTDAQPE